MKERPPPRSPVDGFDAVDPSAFKEDPAESFKRKARRASTAVVGEVVGGLCRGPGCACGGLYATDYCPGCGQFFCEDALKLVLSRSRDHHYSEHVPREATR